ncbi:MAG: sensor domain-containing diguanylate cyclase [Methylobacter sp.]|nr:sensor domain-containing diguanylate cyclase [Methylobacter sp.]
MNVQKQPAAGLQRTKWLSVRKISFRVLSPLFLDRFMQSSLPSMKSLSIWTYVISLTLWLFLCFGAAVIVVILNIRDVEQDLTQYGDAYSDHLNKEMVSSETILKGFSALFSIVGSTATDKASRYVRQVIETNPQIFALEIIQVVTKSQLTKLVASKRSNGIPNFSVRSFSYDSGRKWLPLEEKDTYYPIVFMEPMRPGSEEVLGLDMESVPFLKQAMNESLQHRVPVASHPFKLVEGNLAYVVFFPISLTFQSGNSPPALTTQDELVVEMVIDAVKLVEPVKFPVFNGGTVVVFHKDFRPDNPKGQLLKMSGVSRSSIETALFPAFMYKKSLATMGEPFSLIVKRQVGWSDLNMGMLAMMALLTLMSSLLIVAYLRVHQRNRVLQIENQKRLWQLANHDALTGLPNRMLLMDRLKQMLARSQRQKKRLAVMFLDLNDFKQVNDTCGHEVGDQLLKFVAERLRSTTRADDTVARMSGDEFIILIESVENRESLEAMTQKIQQTLSDGLLTDGKLIPVHTSIGIAIFPDDGNNPEALIKQADMRMYANKKTKSVNFVQFEQ